MKGQSISVAMDKLKTRRQSEMREKILDFEDKLSQHPDAVFGDSDVCPVTHKFTEGLYVREMFMPKGTYIVGKIHKHEHFNFLMRGTIEVVTENGGFQTLKGPLVLVSPPGTKRVGRVITDTVWITVHHNPTNTQDLVELEKIVIAPSFEAYHLFAEKKQSFLSRVKTKLIQLCLGELS